MDRLCELETIHSEWLDPKYIDGFKSNFSKMLSTMKKFEPQLFLQNVKASYLEYGSVSLKSYFRVGNPGLVEDSEEFFGLGLEVVDENEEISNEVKRYGLVFDLEENLQLKTGDELVFYISGLKEK